MVAMSKVKWNYLARNETLNSIRIWLCRRATYGVEKIPLFVTMHYESKRNVNTAQLKCKQAHCHVNAMKKEPRWFVVSTRRKHQTNQKRTQRRHTHKSLIKLEYFDLISSKSVRVCVAIDQFDANAYAFEWWCFKHARSYSLHKIIYGSDGNDVVLYAHNKCQCNCFMMNDIVFDDFMKTHI